MEGSLYLQTAIGFHIVSHIPTKLFFGLNNVLFSQALLHNMIRIFFPELYPIIVTLSEYTDSKIIFILLCAFPASDTVWDYWYQKWFYCSWIRRSVQYDKCYASVYKDIINGQEEHWHHQRSKGWLLREEDGWMKSSKRN